MKYFKTGLALIVPVALTAQVFWWLFKAIQNTIEIFIPSEAFQWWYVPTSIILLSIVIFILGLIFTYIRPLAWIKDKVDHYIISKIPFINKVYAFGKEISDSFITDINNDGDLQVVEVHLSEYISCLGVLTDPKNNIIMVLSAPSPLTGWVLKTKAYKKLDITFMEAVQINTSLGRLGGDKWTTTPKG